MIQTENCDTNSKKIEKYGCIESINSDSKGFCICLDENGETKKYHCPATNNTNCQEVCEKEGHINPSKELSLPNSIFTNDNFEVIIHIKKSFISNDQDELNKIIKINFIQINKIKKIKFFEDDEEIIPSGILAIKNNINVKVKTTNSIVTYQDIKIDDTIELNNLSYYDRINEIEFYHKYESKKIAVTNIDMVKLIILRLYYQM